ncbi:MAG: hypothetical protein LBQ88_18235 [Treponema sp.]|jgi:hypothetical protein|nr:hypothetical protein [Treponema sp.]
MSQIEKDRQILRELAKQVAEIAALPVQEEKKRLWRSLNSLKPERPMVLIDQVCWHEMNVEDKLTLRCEDGDCRDYERHLRGILYRWEYFPVDMVVEPFIRVGKAIKNTMFGMHIEEETLATAAENDVVSHKYENQFNTIDDVNEKIKMPQVSHDAAKTKSRLEQAEYLFDGIMPVRAEGHSPYISIWDNIAMWMGVEPALYAMVDNPDMMHALVKRMACGYQTMVDQMVEQNLLCRPQPSIHCSGAFTDELPAPGYNPESPRTQDIWTCGLAQMLGTVSPAMYKEFEIDYVIPIFERFGLIYYGCCDPLHDRMDVIRLIPHLRKVSMSPWVDKEIGARKINGDLVFSNKPSPAYVAVASFDGDLIRKDLTETREICRRHNCPLEFILKDISTVHNEPERLKKWADIAMEVVSQ